MKHKGTLQARSEQGSEQSKEQWRKHWTEAQERIGKSTEGDRNTERTGKRVLKQTETQRTGRQSRRNKPKDLLKWSKRYILLGCSMHTHTAISVYTCTFMQISLLLAATTWNDCTAPLCNCHPLNILDVYVIKGEMYFHILCEDNIAQILHYRILKSLSPILNHSYFRKRNYSFWVACICISNEFFWVLYQQVNIFLHVVTKQMHPYKDDTT